MDYQWYPGHMTKAVREMQEDIRLIDLVIELLDARVPYSSRNPDIDQLGKGRARLILLNKADLADERRSSLWAQYFREKGYYVAQADSRMKSGMKQIQELIREACHEKTERDRRRGILNRPVRAMVAGIPNVGKSTLINTLAGRACAKTGNRPGVTKGRQWIRLNKSVELLDTPGILWPKFEDQTVGEKLAVIGAIRDGLLLPEELAAWILEFLQREYPSRLQERYGVREETGSTDLLTEIAQARGCLLKGGIPDIRKAAGLIVDDFRSGRLGRITLEIPESAVRQNAGGEKTGGKKGNGNAEGTEDSC